RVQRRRLYLFLHGPNEGDFAGFKRLPLQLRCGGRRSKFVLSFIQTAGPFLFALAWTAEGGVRCACADIKRLFLLLIALFVRRTL
ncbi:MAG: hypothetical protein AAGU74_11495, partial [Bacillota bacterium]